MLKPLLLAVIVAAPVVSPEPVRSAIRDRPDSYALLAMSLALLGGMATQYRAWVHGKVTPWQASAELAFSLVAGLLALWVAIKREWEDVDLYVAAVLLGMAGRPAVLGAQHFLLIAIRTWFTPGGPTDEHSPPTTPLDGPGPHDSGSHARPARPSQPDPGPE